MSFDGLANGETITLRRRQLLEDPDQYGNDQYEDVDLDVEGCSIWPRGAGTELVQAQDTVFRGLTVLAPTGTLVLATDEVTARGGRYTVEGEPGIWHNPIDGSGGGTEIQLTRVTG